MEDIKNFVLSLCGSTAIVSLCKLVLSNSKLKKTTNVFFSIFVLLYTMLPITKINLEENKMILNEEIEFDDSYYTSGYEAVITEAIKNICVENNIDVISVELNTYNEDDYVMIENISVTILDKSKITETESLLKKELGFEVSVN